MIQSLIAKKEKADGLPLPKRYWAILAIALGVSLSVLDTTIANVALPTISDELHTSPSTVIWVVNAYQLSTIISILSFSSLGEIWGYKKVYLTGISLFIVASLMCALSTSFWTLIAARILQGFGASAITSVNTSLLRIIYPQRFLGRGMGINALVVAFSLAAGPTIASIILSFASWHWLFAVNIPVGLLALVVGFRFLPLNQVSIKGRKFDFISSLGNALTFALLLFVMESISHQQKIQFILFGVILFAIVSYKFIRRQLRQKYPLLPVDLLKIPIFALSIGTSVTSFTAQMLAMVSLPFFLQKTLGYSGSEIGFLLTPWPLAIIVVAPIAGWLVERVHAGLLGAIGLAIFSLGLFLLAFLPNNPSDFSIIWRMVICGAGFGLFQSPNNSVIVSSAPAYRSGGASGMLGTARLLGQTLGTALVAMIFSLIPGTGTQSSLLLAGIFAALAAMVSSLRLSQPLPASLKKEKVK